VVVKQTRTEGAGQCAVWTPSSTGVDTQRSSDEESEAEVGEEEEEIDDEFCDRTKAPVPKWEALVTNKAVWTQLCQQLQLKQGQFGIDRRGCGVGRQVRRLLAIASVGMPEAARVEREPVGATSDKRQGSARRAPLGALGSQKRPCWRGWQQREAAESRRGWFEDESRCTRSAHTATAAMAALSVGGVGTVRNHHFERCWGYSVRECSRP
jgi:hypothetical protein